MKLLIPAALLTALACGQIAKSVPNEASNRNVELVGQAFTDRKEITSLVGMDLGEDVVVVRIRVSPKSGDPLAVSMDDFTLVSRKDGEKSGAMDPAMIAGSSRLVLQGPERQGTLSQASTAPPVTPPLGVPVGGVGFPGGVTMGTNQNGVGTASTESGLNEIQAKRDDNEDPRMAAMEAKILKDAESAQPVEGLMYFLMNGKVKPKNLGLIYAGPAGRLVIDFK